MKWTMGYILLVNLVTYFHFAWDKHRARKNQWRISEKRLLVLAFCGGAIGAWRGMQDHHHKVNKNMFRFMVPIFAILQLILMGYLSGVWSIPETYPFLIGGILVHILAFGLLRWITKWR